MWFAMLLAGCLAGYQESDTDLEPVGPMLAGPDGGVFVFGEASIQVPEGALTEEVELFLYETDEDLPEGYDSLSKLWRAEPEGLVFETPVIVRLPYRPADTPDPQLYWSDDGGGYSRKTTFNAENGGVARAYVEHFSTGFVATLATEVVEEASPYPPADVLFIIDNSCSMIEEQTTLAAAMPQVFPLLDATGVDYHVGVVSTDMDDTAQQAGKLRVFDGESYIDTNTANPSIVFSAMAVMGTNGSFEEKGRAAAYSMVELKRDIPRNAGFYRDEATLSLIFVSDEEDQSGPDPINRSDFQIWMETLKPSPSEVVAHGFVFPATGPCPAGDTRGMEYVRYADWTGGIITSLCAPDWTPGLQEMFDRLLDTARVRLPPAADVIRVTLVGATTTELTPGQYRFDPVSNTVYLDQGTRPAVDESVRVEFLPL